MPRVGSLGLDMMLRTCTVQANLDFGDEAEIARYGRFMDAVCELVVKKYDGSLRSSTGCPCSGHFPATTWLSG